MGESERMEKMNYTFLTVGSRFWRLSLAPEEPQCCEAQTWLKCSESVRLIAKLIKEVNWIRQRDQIETEIWSWIEESFRVRVGVGKGIELAFGIWHLFNNSNVKYHGSSVFYLRTFDKGCERFDKRALHVWKQSHAFAISRKLKSGNKWQNIIVFYSYFFLTTRNAIYEFIPWSTLFHFPETKERSRSVVIKSNFYFQSSIKKDKIKK